jgi:hypothetical protein
MRTRMKLGLLLAPMLALAVLVGYGLFAVASTGPSAMSDDLEVVHFKGTVQGTGMDPAPGPGFYWNVLVQEVIGFIGPPLCETVDVYGPDIPECFGDWENVPQDSSAIGTAVEVKGYYNPPYQMFLCGSDHFIEPLDSTPNPCPTVSPTPTATPSPTPSPTPTPTPTATPSPGLTRTLHWGPGWHNEIWTGASPPEEAFACADGKYAAAYRWVDGGWERHFPDRPDVSNMGSLDQYDAFLILITDDVTCEMPVADAPGTERTLAWSMGWQNDGWTGADGTAFQNALECVEDSYAAAYRLVSGSWQRHFPERLVLSTMGSLDQYSAFFILMTDDATCSMPISADHATPSPTPSPSPSPTPSPTPCVPTVEITVDKGEGATYCIGDPVQVCTEVSCPTYVYLYTISGGQPPVLFASGTTEGEECNLFSVGEPAGVHTLRMEATDGGQVVASDETWFTVSSCAQ